jgi:hypothetical protein
MSLIGIRHPSIENLVITMAVSVTALLILIGLIQRYRAQPRPDGLLATYNRLCQRTGKVVRDRRPAEGPHEYLAAMCAQRPDLATELRRLFGMYVQLRYDGIVNEQLRRKFFAAVRVFRPSDQTAAG